MIQRFPKRASGVITSAGTALTAFDNIAAGAVTFVAGADNSGTVTIVGAGGGSTLGIVLAAGERFTPPAFVTNLSQFKYQFSQGSDDTLEYLVLQG